MLHDTTNYGIETNTGRPYVWTLRGSVVFDTTDDAAEFVCKRVKAQLSAYLSVWESLDPDMREANGEVVVNDGDFAPH